MRISRTRAAIAALGAVLASAGPAAAGDGTFTAAPDLALDPKAGAQAVAVGDFDSDGKHDLAILDFRRDRVEIRLGNGDGTFHDAPAITGLARGTDIVVGDFDGDGVEDLAVAASQSPTYSVEVYRGLGDGRFNETTAFTPDVFSLAVGDYNGDGKEDLAMAGPAYVRVRLGMGNGQFAAGTDIVLTAPYPGDLASADFDGDGKEDLVVCFALPNGVGVLAGKGDGTFAAPKTVPTPNQPDQVTVGDFNTDGRADAAVTVFQEDRVSIRLGNGDGTLSDDAPDVPVGDSPHQLAVGDFNSDGREDLAVTDREGDKVSVRPGGGDGTFGDGPELDVGDFPLGLAIGDLDRDGNEDLAIGNYGSPSVSVRLGAGAPPLAGNLLVNGGFEQGAGARLPIQSPAIPGWSTTGGATFVRYGITPHLGFPSWLDSARYGGGFHFFSGGDSTGLGGITTASQEVDVASTAEAIDEGRATARLSALLGGAQAYPDNTTVAADFLNADGQSIGAFQVGPVTADDRRGVTSLLGRAASAPVPAGARRVRVTLTSTDTDTASSATADNVKLTLDARPRDDQPDPPPPPPRSFGADTKVTLSLAARRIAARDPIRVRVANANEFPVTGSVTGRRPARLRAQSVAVPASSRTVVRFTVAKALRRKLRRKHRLVLRLSAVVRDPAGNRRTVVARGALRLKTRHTTTTKEVTK